MHAHRLRSPLAAALLLASVAVLADVGAALTTAKPESVGFSSERLGRLDQAMQATIDNKQLAGAITVLARHGKVVGFNTYGQQDIASGKPMQKDSIFRIYSMTKPVTGAAMMILYEEGKWRASDPIAKFLPEFKDVKVYAGQGADGQPILETPKHAPTVGEVMTHTAGFTYGFFGSGPVDKIYMQAKVLEAGSLKEFTEKLAKLPLAYQPGEGWEYSVAVDVQGALVERLSGMPFAQFLEDRLFKPLGMVDTAFFVPENKLSRLATIYTPGPNATLAPMPRDANVSKAPAMPSGGGGLYSTATDYLRFAQMLANEGELNGMRVLAPSSVRLMRSNQLPDRLRTGKHGIGYYRMQPGLGFGYDVAVIEDPTKVGSTAGAGTYLWDGVAGTWFWVDPTNDVVFIGMIQRWMMAPGMPNLEDLSRALVYQALVEPEK
jgi:CubicO group peptidase (beta-lactamase class C family)